MRNSSCLWIDLDRVRENVTRIQEACGMPFMPIVKAGGYGTSATRLAKLYASCSLPFIGVSYVSEAVALREAGITHPLYVIHTSPFEAELLVSHHITPAVASLDVIEALAEAAKAPYPLHLQVNTGMNRFGVRPEEAPPLLERIAQAPNLFLEGVSTHFAAADDPNFDVFTQEQIETFRHFVEGLSPQPKWIHALTTAGMGRFKLPFCNLVRTGVAPLGLGTRLSGLKPALKLESYLSAITHGEAGESVGYKRLHTLKKKTPVGVIPFGYYDGMHRHFSGKGYVKIRGKKAPLIGLICMDFMLVDLSDIPNAEVGDEVVIFDKEVTPEQWGKWGEANFREMLCSLGPRTERIFLERPKLRRSDTDETSSERLPSPFQPFEENPTSR